MHNYSNNSVLSFTSKQLFDIVIDVKSYPLFLPWCLSSKVINKKNNCNFDATLNVGYKAIDQEYTSRIHALDPSQIKSRAISGPFNYLESIWNFKDQQENNTCKVTFNIEYEFKSFFLDKVMGIMFKNATIKMLKAFENRAYELYN